MPLQPKLDPVAIKELTALQDVVDEVRLARAESADFKKHVEVRTLCAAVGLLSGHHECMPCAARSRTVPPRLTPLATIEGTLPCRSTSYLPIHL